ncbi:arylacetamide deacetylase-like 3 isoform X2 [Paroedura picta]
MDMAIEMSEYFKCILGTLASDIIFWLTWLLEKLGISSQIKLLRWMASVGEFQSNPNFHTRDEQFDNVPVRIYEPKNPVSKPGRCIIYLHGGVGLIGTIRAYAAMCRKFARESGTMVVDVGYRLAPEHPHPAQIEDCMSAVIHLLKEARNYGVDPNRVVLVGDSSGGTLVSVVSQRLVARKDLPKIRAQVLIYPATQGIDLTLPSYQQNPMAPILTTDRALQLATKFVTDEPVDFRGFKKNAHVPDGFLEKYRKWISADCIPDEFKARGYVPIARAPFSEKLYKIFEITFQNDTCPLLSEDDIIRQLPETFLLTCEYDVLRDDGLLYKKRLEDNGVPLTWLHLDKGFHGIMFHSDYAPFQFKDAAKAMGPIVDFIQKC